MCCRDIRATVFVPEHSPRFKTMYLKRRQASPPVRDLGATKIRHKQIGPAALPCIAGLY
jgi:hypothetical protein